MKLKVSRRPCGKKSDLTRIRYEGNIPAAIYGKGKEVESLVVDGSEFGAALRSIQKGHLATTVFELDVDGKMHKAIVKEIQYAKTSYKPLHLDFYLLTEDQEITVNVPLFFEGVVECAGIKLGGFLRQIKRYIKVRCLPKHMPKSFHVDVRELGMNQSKRVKDIQFPAGVHPLISEKEVIVVIGK